MSYLSRSPATVVLGDQPIQSPSTSYGFPIQRIHFTPAELESINARLALQTPQQILEWAIRNLPGLYQTTAFGLTGMVALDMVSKISAAVSANEKTVFTHLVPLIFLDTLYHFPETLELAERARREFGADLHIFKAGECENTKEFEDKFGERLWETDEDSYDYLVKVEPARRAYDELDVQAVITGRRRSQGADRASIPILEVDETGLYKLNPLANWSFNEVKQYIDKNDVPYNALLDQGYKSVGDWHSTKKPDGTVSSGAPTDDGGERSGRWAGQAAKTECGLHKDYFKMKMAFAKKQREKEAAARDIARDSNKPVMFA